MFNKIREANYMLKMSVLATALKEKKEPAYLIKMEANTLKSNAANDLLMGKISEKVYKILFCPEGANIDHHFLDIFLENYGEERKGV